MTPSSIDFDRLLKLRVVVARFGEMDLVRWWNTKGQLGPYGTSTLKRGFPRTHHFAQARSVFAVAAHRCLEIFDRADCVTLWRLPEATEEEFDARWETWLDHAGDWTSFFQRVESLRGEELPGTLRHFGLVTEADVTAASKLKRSAEGRALAVPGTYAGTETDLALLALGFSRGEPGALAVPHMSRADG